MSNQHKKDKVKYFTFKEILFNRAGQLAQLRDPRSRSEREQQRSLSLLTL
jgi:hypothetical protein